MATTVQQFSRNWRKARRSQDEVEAEFAALVAAVMQRQRTRSQRRLAQLRRQLAAQPTMLPGQRPARDPSPRAPSLRASEVFASGLDEDMRETLGPPIRREHNRVGTLLIGAAAFGAARLAGAQVFGQIGRLNLAGFRAISKVEGVLSAAYQDGATFDLMVDIVSDLFDVLAGSFAAQTGRAEANAVFNGASVAAADAEGLAVVKVWTSQEDDRVRDSHERAHGQRRPLTDPFDVGNDQLLYPGDPDGVIEEIANCRCYLHYLSVTGDEVELGGEDFDF